MARELLILRHGKSDWDAGVRDIDRPLKNRGKRGAQKIGIWLWQQNLRPDQVVSSPAERAITTAQKCVKAMGMSAKTIEQDQRVYAASLGDLLTVLADAPGSAQRVMLVGHNPGLEELLIFLAGQEVPFPDDGKLLPTATLAHLSLPDDWADLSSACATLKQIVRPRSLPEGFPYPAPGGDEIRERPAYYYSQSAVIPYRVIEDGSIEYLIISSSKNNHWVVPKGIKDPGLTPQESAAKEAWEEAGIRGEVSDDRLGSYMVEKWGAECHVDVFAMQVIEVVEEDEWEERHRERQWLSAEEAAKCLRQPELGQMLLMLATSLEQ